MNITLDDAYLEHSPYTNQLVLVGIKDNKNVIKAIDGITVNRIVSQESYLLVYANNDKCYIIESGEVEL